MSTRLLRPPFTRGIALGAVALTVAGLTLASPAQEARERGEGRSFDPQDFVERLMQNDANGDGVLSRAEVPERLAERLFAADANGDDALDRDELTAFMETTGFGRGRGPGGPEGRGGEPGGPASFEQAMEGINRTMRGLNRSDFNAETRDEDLARVGAIEAALVAAKSRLDEVAMAPRAKARYGDDERAFRDAMRASLIAAIGTTLRLETAIAAGDAEGVKEQLEVLGDAEDAAHEVFRPERERR